MIESDAMSNEKETTVFDRGLGAAEVTVATGAVGASGLGAVLAGRKLSAAGAINVQQIRKAVGDEKIEVQTLRGNVSVLMNAGGNIAVLAGRDGILMVDAGLAAARARIVDALAGISPSPIKHLINTHWHFDHTDGNEWVHAAGATIVAHENTRKHLRRPRAWSSGISRFRPHPPARSQVWCSRDRTDCMPTTLRSAEFHRMLVDIRDRVAALTRQGVSLDEVIATHPTAAFDEKWGGFLMTPRWFTLIVYTGV